ncbi:MAG TPA: DUF499 domain-containing protein [Anaerolineae bacterium]|nr:DUF499 domain-containing protein [Anaerolineae bacterium]
MHLDLVQDQRGNAIYWQPEQFFSRTYLTRNLLDFAAEAVRRLAGITTSTSAGFNLTTQFGGGKTHALTLLYHLARSGPAGARWFGVPQILERAGLPSVPEAKIAVFVGMRFDPRGGDDGTPRRETPWEEIAWQLAGAPGVLLMQDAARGSGAPGGDTIGRLFKLVDRPVLVLMDEVMSYISRYRASGLGGQMYNFIHTLSEEARSHKDVVVAVSIPVSEAEMTAEDWDDYRRLMKMLDRLAKPVLLSAEADIPEIIRRRLFEWDERALDAEGRVLLPRDAVETCNAYAAWVQEHRSSLPSWFPIDRVADAFKASYPFHPTLISVFERKWQALPSFQRTRGVLRLLALWVSFAQRDSYRTAGRDPLLGLGSAPLDEPLFRAAVFKQLGEDKLETVVTADICGARGSHATRLDEDATEAIRKARLHRQVASAIFFESNGGMAKGHATVPEVRLAVGQPGLDVGNVETVLEAMAPPDGVCFYLDVLKNRYWFSMRPNLTQVLADRRAAVSGDPRIDEYVRAEIVKQFGQTAEGVTLRPFPQDSGKIPNQPALTVVVLPPEQSLAEQDATLAVIERWTREYGSSARTFKSALVWAVADGPARLRSEAQKLLAWESIEDDEAELQFSESQREQLRRNVAKARGDLKEAVWSSYNKVVLLGKDNRLRTIDIGPTNSSAASTLSKLIVRELRKYGEVDDSPSPNFLVRHWPPAFVEWSTKSIRDACFASPQFLRLLDPTSIRDTVARGVSNGILAYVGKGADGQYHPFYFNQSLASADVEITDDMFVITAERAEAYLRAQAPAEPEPPASATVPSTPALSVKDGPGAYRVAGDEAPEVQPAQPGRAAQADEHAERPAAATVLTWSGDVPSQKWVNFYMKVLTKLAATHTLQLSLHVRASGAPGISQQKAEEVSGALRELGLDDRVTLT